jgi:imidazole glycerol-phosphate synthase subunit HisH
VSVSIIDIGIGNIGSLSGALFNQGWDVDLVTNRSQLAVASHLILPGVGAFGEGMRRLRESGLYEGIRAHANLGKPLLGICLGMQLLAYHGEEEGGGHGLALIPGQVRKLPVAHDQRLPHVGWNTVTRTKNHHVLDRIRDDVDFYFVHSYQFVTERDFNVLGVTEYGQSFSSMVVHQNVVGVQFHPEKSQRNGLQLLDNFCLWDGSC